MIKDLNSTSHMSRKATISFIIERILFSLMSANESSSARRRIEISFSLETVQDGVSMALHCIVVNVYRL